MILFNSIVFYAVNELIIILSAHIIGHNTDKTSFDC